MLSMTQYQQRIVSERKREMKSMLWSCQQPTRKHLLSRSNDPRRSLSKLRRPCLRDVGAFCVRFSQCLRSTAGTSKLAATK